MSAETITTFLDKARTDEALAAKILAINTGTEAEVAEAFSRLAAEAGLPFTAEEFLASRSNDLSDADLEQVAGGTLKDILDSVRAKSTPYIRQTLPS